MHQKCHKLLWPERTYASFDFTQLHKVLLAVKLPTYLTQHYRINKPDTESPSLIDSFYNADPSAALCRMVLTISIQSEAYSIIKNSPQIFDVIWSTSLGKLVQIGEKNPTIEERIQYYRLIDLAGDRKKAYEGYCEIAKMVSNTSHSVSESKMFDRMGEMLINGDGHYVDYKEGLKWLRCGCYADNPYSYYLLAIHTEGNEAREALETAVKYHVPGALRELGNAYMSGLSRYGYKCDLDAAISAFRAGLADRGIDGANCALMLGKLYESQNQIETAEGAYQTAADLGLEEAFDSLSRLNVQYRPSISDKEDTFPSVGKQVEYCICNDLSGMNNVFVESLPDSCKKLISNEGFQTSLRKCLHERYSCSMSSFPHLVIALMSSDNWQNLCTALDTIKELNRAVALLKGREWEFVESIDIYVMCNHTEASALLDTAMMQLGRLYYNVHLYDYALDSAFDLFSRAPLFQPVYLTEGEQNIRLNIIGSGSNAIELLCVALALPLPDRMTLTVSVFGSSVQAMKKSFFERCPGIRDSSPSIHRTIPNFYEIREEADMFMLSKSQIEDPKESNPENTTARIAFSTGNYYIAATQDDQTNIRIAANLRRNLIKNSVTFSNIPLIAVQVSSPSVGSLLSRLSSGSNSDTSQFFRHHNLFPFGMMSMYTFRHLNESIIENRARSIHLHYAKSLLTKEEYHDSMASYFKRQYNRDSSRLTSLALPYRLFQAGIKLPSWHMYGTREEMQLSGQFDNWLSEADNTQIAARREHERWNRMMLSMGWEQATITQTETYLLHGNGGHQLYIGKLHPFICAWDELRDGRIFDSIQRAVLSKYPDRVMANPCDADIEAVKNTEDILLAPWKTSG